MKNGIKWYFNNIQKKLTSIGNKINYARILEMAMGWVFVEYPPHLAPNGASLKFK